MSGAKLTAEQEAEAERIQAALRQASEAEIEQIARLLASKPDHQLLGQTEFEVRDLVQAIGAKALEIGLEERKKRGTRAPARPVRDAESRRGLKPIEAEG